MSESQWLQFTGQPANKRKRADLACTICHSKKVKCDLQSRIGSGFDRCTNCYNSSKECHTRPSKRDKTRRVTKDDAGGPLTPPGSTGDKIRDIRQGIAPHVPTWNRFQGQHQPTGVGDQDQPVQTVSSTVAPVRRMQSIISSGAQLPQSADGILAAMVDDSPATDNTDPVTEHNYPVDAGFLQVYGPENQSDARNQAVNQALGFQGRSDIPSLPPPELQQSFADTYFEYCYTWCPVLDRDGLAEQMSRSSMLANAVALVGSHVQPPLLPHDGPAAYYDRARREFYEDEEGDVMLSLKAVSLFYWWSPRPPTTVHRHSSWWWQSVIIRHCQHMGVHRESAFGHPLQVGNDLGLRRRIWWTAFARERLTALCQSRPAIIDPEDCNIAEPTMDDFPGLQPRERVKAEIFIYWVRLCAIIGKVAKFLCKKCDQPSPPFPDHLARELIDWIGSLPAHLRLSIESDRTTTYSRDVHQLHLPYLTVIIILHLKRSTQPLPEAYAPAIMAATCIARILKDILARGGTRHMMAISCWYTGSAFTALSQACRSERLATAGSQDLDICMLAIDQLRKMWPTGNIIHGAFQRLRKPDSAQVNSYPAAQLQTVFEDVVHNETGFDWISYFPFASPQTSELAGKLLQGQSCTADLFPTDAFTDAAMYNFTDLLEPYDTFPHMDLFV